MPTPIEQNFNDYKKAETIGAIVQGHLLQLLPHYTNKPPEN
jgi:hypothetical protein